MVNPQYSYTLIRYSKRHIQVIPCGLLKNKPRHGIMHMALLAQTTKRCITPSSSIKVVYVHNGSSFRDPSNELKAQI